MRGSEEPDSSWEWCSDKTRGGKHKVQKRNSDEILGEANAMGVVEK